MARSRDKLSPHEGVKRLVHHGGVGLVTLIKMVLASQTLTSELSMCLENGLG